MKRELWNLMVLMIAPILLTLAWNLQASDETPPNEQLQAAPPDTLLQYHQLYKRDTLSVLGRTQLTHPDSMTYSMQIINPDSLLKGLRVPKVDPRLYKPGTRDLLLRPADKADYYVRDLLLRPEDTLTTRYIDPRLKPHPLQLEKPK